MKILHTADWHLGRVLHGVSLEDFQAEFLDFFVDLVRAEAPDAVVIAGDIFDRSIAPVSALRLMDAALAQLAQLTRVIIIPGNHDSAARLGYGAGLYAENVVVFSQPEQVGTPVVLGSGAAAVNIYPIPYLEPDLARYALADPQLGEPTARSHQAVNEAAAARIFADLEARTGIALVVAHPFVAGSTTSESERDISVGGVQSIAVDTFQDPAGQVRYVACGHLHRPQTLVPPQGDAHQYCVRYAGSPLPFSFSEGADRKSLTRLTICDGRVEVSEIPIPQPYQLEVFRGSLAQLLDFAAALPEGGKVFYSVEITDPLRPEHLFAQVKQALPTVMQIRHVGVGEFAAQAPVAPAQSSPGEVCQQFFTAALGRELSAAEVAVVEQIWEELRVSEGALCD